MTKLTELHTGDSVRPKPEHARQLLLHRPDGFLLEEFRHAGDAWLEISLEGEPGWYLERMFELVSCPHTPGEGQPQTDDHSLAAAPQSRVRMTAHELSGQHLGHLITIGVGSHVVTAVLDKLTIRHNEVCVALAGIVPTPPVGLAAAFGAKPSSSFRLAATEPVLVDPNDEVETLAALVIDGEQDGAR